MGLWPSLVPISVLQNWDDNLEGMKIEFKRRSE